MRYIYLEKKVRVNIQEANGILKGWMIDRIPGFVFIPEIAA